MYYCVLTCITVYLLVFLLLTWQPIDWDEDAPEFIPDEEAVKPEGWLDDEEELIPDPSADRPADWDDDMDGEWEAPKIDNPKCQEAPGEY